jgi:Fis family transcriptional regulator
VARWLFDLSDLGEEHSTLPKGEAAIQYWTTVENNNNQNDSLISKKSKKPLCKHTEDALDQYFIALNGDRPGDLYDLVIGEVERPLFKAVMDYTQGNQSQAAGILGLNRGTLRKKLRTYSLIQK